jgi:hypothetical protein
MNQPCTITFKAKRRIVEYAGHPELHAEYIEVPVIERKHCNVNAFRSDSRFGAYANSDLFGAVLRRELTRLGIGKRITFEDQFGKYPIPESVTIEPGFLDTVTITL